MLLFIFPNGDLMYNLYMCMYIYVHYAYVYVHVYMCIYIYVHFVYVYVYVCVHKCLGMCMYIRVSVSWSPLASEMERFMI